MTPEATAAAVQILRAAGIENAVREVRLLSNAANSRRDLDEDHAAAGTIQTRFDDLLTRRAAREPMSHLLGYRDFYNHRFVVTADVLDPRPDTETLVEQCLALPFTRVLDLGTGSGCILLSLLAAREAASGVGADYSQAALDVALRNVASLSLETRASLICSDWFAQVEGVFDLIVSNPPYIAAEDMAALQPEVQVFEPRMALTDGANGLSCYTAILAGFDRHLTAGGWLAVEIGASQGAAVSQMMTVADLQNVRVVADLNGRDRVVLGQKSA